MLFLTPDEGLVLHSTINRKLKSIAKKVGIDEIISTHCLRHTYATRAIENSIKQQKENVEKITKNYENYDTLYSDLEERTKHLENGLKDQKENNKTIVNNCKKQNTLILNVDFFKQNLYLYPTIYHQSVEYYLKLQKNYRQALW